MSIRMILCTVALAALLAPPLSAQSGMKHMAVDKEMKSGPVIPIRSQPKTRAVVKAQADLDRLESLLMNARGNQNIDGPAWKTIAGEASVLANRIQKNSHLIFAGKTSSRDAAAAARDLVLHVREMRKAAMAGDAAGTRAHAAVALPFAFQLDTLIG